MSHRPPMTSARLAIACVALAAVPVALVIGAPAAGGSVRPGPSFGRTVRTTSPIAHIVVIVQENRTVDNLFQLLPGANTQRWGLNAQGQKVRLRPIPLSGDFDPSHNHLPSGINTGGFVTEYDNGMNDGWASESFHCKSKKTGCPDATAYAYVRRADVLNYYDIAQHYAFSDMTFQTNEGPSFPAHQYLIAGQSGGLFDMSTHLSQAENPKSSAKKGGGATGGCDEPNFTAQAIDMLGAYPGTETGIFPCEDYQTIFDALDATYPSVTYNWRYYMPAEASIWSAPIGVKHLYEKYLAQGGPSGAGNFSIDPGGTKFQADVKAGKLAPVTYVMPCAEWSDHPAITSTLGPSWVSFLENTVGKSAYWKSTAIILLWDDWGGWFDHVTPGHTPNVFDNPEDPYEYGYRVPLVVISPYAKHGYIDHTPQTQMSILTFIEDTFGTSSLGAADQMQYSGSDLTQMFDFTAKPAPYHPEPVPTGEFPQGACPSDQPDIDG